MGFLREMMKSNSAAGGGGAENTGSSVLLKENILMGEKALIRLLPSESRATIG